MSSFVVNAGRLDPYKNYRFRVLMDGKVVAGVSKVSGLVRKTEVIASRTGNEPVARLSAGNTHFAPIILERGVTYDPTFENWANQVYSAATGQSSPSHMRKDLIIELLNESGQVAKSYKLFRCWPSVYQALSDLDADGASVLIEMIEIQVEGWERDLDVPEPNQP